MPLGAHREGTKMAAIWRLIIIGLNRSSIRYGVTMSPLRLGAERVISRAQDPDSFRKAFGINTSIGLLFIIGWFMNRYWSSFF